MDTSAMTMPGVIAQPLSVQSHKGERLSGALLALPARDRGPRPTRQKRRNAMTQTAVAERGSKQAADNAGIRPFQMDVPEAELTELRRRVNATKWPERE